MNIIKTEKSETIRYNGYNYRRYPNSSSLSIRTYFSRFNHKTNKSEALHRRIWIDHNGPIPDKHHIHHIDHDTLNNDISNLVCVAIREHGDLHSDLTDKDKTYKRNWARNNRKPVITLKTKFNCKQCNTEFESHQTDRAAYCSLICRQRAKVLRDGTFYPLPPEPHKCAVCNIKYIGRTSSKTCSDVCNKQRQQANMREYYLRSKSNG